MKKIVDLHLHTKYSDGIYTPVELINKSVERGLSAIAITDHDTVKAFQQGVELSREEIEVIPGIEMSSDLRGTEVHILGYFLDVFNKLLNSTLKKIMNGRKQRSIKIIEKLNSLGYDIQFNELKGITTNNYYSRPDIAELCVKKNFFSHKDKVFKKLLNPGKPAYVSRFSIEPDEIIDIIHQSGGLAVWAHPKYTKNHKYMFKYLLESGIDGIEVYHSQHSKKQIKAYMKYAEKYNLLITGGSDYHGTPGIFPEIWDFKLPYSYFEKLKNCKVS